MDLDDSEHQMIRRMLQVYVPRPSNALIDHITNWIREHTSTICNSNRALPTRWMWEWVVYLLILETCGMAELKSSNVGLQEDLLSQLELPAWARTAMPIRQWTRGEKGMTPGHLYAGMKMGALERARSLTSRAPAFPPEALRDLQTIVESAMPPPGDTDEQLPPQQPNTGQLAAPLPPPSQPPPAANAPSPPDTSEASEAKRKRSSSSHTFGEQPNCSLSEGIPSGLPPRIHNETEEMRQSLRSLQNHSSPRARGMSPRLGRGEVHITSSNGTAVSQACAASSITQLLCDGYKRTYSEAEAADLALATQQMTGIANGSALYISDVWWKALTDFLPAGPWPGLMVCYAPREVDGQSRTIDLDRSSILRLPGPVDDRLFGVIGDGGHFDPIWWPSANGITALVQDLTPRVSRKEPTLTPDMGPGVGALLLWGAKYHGCALYSGHGSGELSQNHAVSTINRCEHWQSWIAWLNSHRGLPAEFSDPRSVVTLECAHPTTPYPDFCSRELGIQMLAPCIRLFHAANSAHQGGVVALAFDHLGCHIGFIPSTTADEALTRLQIHSAQEMPRGHPGL